jgi:hypothetical protein
VPQNAGWSSGLRLDTRVLGPPVHTTTSSSTQLPPALRISVFRLGHDVMVRLRAWSASTMIHGPWQITATGLPASKNPLTKSTAAGTVRRKSGLATPPGSTKAA